MKNIRMPRRLYIPPALFGAAALVVIVFYGAAMAQQGGAGATSAPTAAAEALPVNPAQKQTLWELFVAGGPVMYALLFSSVIAIAIVIERLVSLRRGAVVPSGFIPGLLGTFRDPVEDRQQALTYCKSHDSAISR